MVKVSLGLPVYNGERFLNEAIASALGQSFDDLELIICDNASTDATWRICEEAAAADDRVVIHRNPENIGAAANFNRTVELASGTYFKWVAHDDLIASDYLEKCVGLLDADPSLVHCHSEIQVVDDGGALVRHYDPELSQVGSISPSERFEDWTRISHWCLDVFGLMRTDVLRRTHLIAPYIASDRSLLAELGLHGRFARVPEELFFSREHTQRSIRAMPLHQRAAWFDPSKPKRIAFPHFRLWYEYVRLVRAAPISSEERRACYQVLIEWGPRHRKRLLRDMKSFVRTLMALAQERTIRPEDGTDGS